MRYLEVNPAFERHTGQKRSDILGHCALELFPDAEPVWFEQYGQVATTGVPAHFQARFGPLDRWFEVSAYRTGPGRIATVFFDITERKQAEHERQMFVSLAENSHEFVGMCDLDYMPIFVNEAGLRLVGLDSLAQAIQTPIRDFFFPEDHARVIEEFFPRAVADGHGEIEIRFRHFKTAEPIWMIHNVLVLKDHQGHPTGIGTVSLNITERKKSEEAIRRAEARFRNMADNAPAMLWVTDSAGRCTYLSSGWYEFTGRCPGEAGPSDGWKRSMPRTLRGPQRSFRMPTESTRRFASTIA